MLLFVSSPTFDLPAFVRDLKKNTNKICNEDYGFRGMFAWQSGYFAQALGRDRVDVCYNYIKNQQAHHVGMSFSEEWEKMKSAFEMDVEKTEKYSD